MAALRTLAGDNVILCDPCENEGRFFKAEGYCTECSDYLCSDCIKIHRRPVLWRFHQILTRQEMPTLKSLEEVKDECVEPCTQHRGKILEFFCPTHDELACSLCMFRNHRLCQDVSYIPEIADSVIENNELNELKDKFAGLLNDIDTYKKLAVETLAEAEEVRKKAVKRVTDLKHDICSFLDQVLEDIAIVNQSDSSAVKATDSSLNRISKMIKTHVSVLDKKEKENKRSQLFVAAKRFKVDLKEMQDEVEESKENCTVKHYEDVVTENSILETRKCLEKIWNLNVRNEKPCQFVRENETEQQHTDSKKWPVLENLKKQTDVLSSCHNLEDRDLDTNIPEQLIACCFTTDAETETSTKVKGRWSPANPSGIRQYDREFLLELQTSFHALRKPVGVVDIPGIILDKPLINEEGLVNTTVTDFGGFCDQNKLIGRKSKKKVHSLSRSLLLPTAIPFSEEGQGEVSQMCKDHENQPIEYYCDDDDMIICSRCVIVGNHRGHNISSIEEKVQKQADRSTAPQSCTGVSMKTIRQTMYMYILKEMVDNHGIISWIDSNVDASVRSGNTLIKILMTNICKHSLEKDDESECLFDVDKIRDRRDLLRKYLKRNPDLELQALCALLLFPGNIREILQVLYDADIISEDGFFKWETSEVMKECKEIITKHIVPFFTWLLTKDKRK